MNFSKGDVVVINAPETGVHGLTGKIEAVYTKEQDYRVSIPGHNDWIFTEDCFS